MQDTLDRLLLLTYEELRRRARAYLRAEGGGYQTLDPTALVHEAYSRLALRRGIAWQGKTHFLAIAAGEMRRVLVERARAAGARKRGGRPGRVTLGEVELTTPARSVDVLALEEALSALAARSTRQARVAEMRLFAGMGAAEISEVLRVSERTVKGDWRLGRAWLARALRAEPPP
jgi:RNA polymerase sigma-70 factor (ECF subfamily)